jgi:YidC/Oxa1 family membrane protein insertase
MGMDKNTVIGFVLIGALLMGMFYINSRSRLATEGERLRIEDSIKLANPVDTNASKIATAKLDSQKIAASNANFQKPTTTTETLTTIENEVLKISFTNKGGQPKTVELKNFKTYDGKPLYLQTGNFNKLEYAINGSNNQVAQTGDLFFELQPTKINADKTQTIAFTLKDSSGSVLLTHQYTIKPNDYLVDFNIEMQGANKLVSQNTINLTWQAEYSQLEKTLSYEKEQTHICYLSNGKYDFEMLSSGGAETFSKPVDWLAVNPQFFVQTLIAKNKFQSAEISWITPADSLRLVTQSTAHCKINLPTGVTNASVPMQIYYGPNDYNVLDKYNNQMHQITTYGSGPFSFVKYINRHFLLPVWDFIRSHIASYGIVILLLTLLIRLITSPILYKSYVSGAKMKALKPEIDKLKEKFGEDKQGFSMEQMKLWKSAGVSPLGGCLPALLQIPIFMSLYYFFQSNIALRGQSFLWAKDLAAYDSIAQLPFNIPFYGDHVSLFTLTATLTSLLISVYSMSNMQDNSNPVMKYMPYIFPILLLGVFNKLPAALTWYYTISNFITLVLQIVIQKYIINHDKILAQIEINRKKPVKQNKLQERMLAMQESNKKLQDLKAKNNKK